MPTILIILAVVAILVFLYREGLLSSLGKPHDTNSQKNKHTYQYKPKPYFMTKSEHHCYDVLIDTFGDQYYIFAQVHLPTIVDEQVPGQSWRGARSHISRKSVDFVLCDKEKIAPQVAIELDDASHNRPSRQKRDAEVERILTEAQIPLLRIQHTDLEDTEVLAKRVSDLRNK